MGNIASFPNLNNANEPVHIPVMLEEVLTILSPSTNKTYVDATYGSGGYSKKILSSAKCKLIAIDRDPDAYANAEKESLEWKGRLVAVCGCFGDLEQLLNSEGIKSNSIDGVIMDLGVSSVQLCNPVLGFSFSSDGPLDMRMSRFGQTAADVINTFSEQEIADILYKLGGERYSRRIARRLVKARSDEPILRTKQLADIVSSALPREHRNKRGSISIHPATRSFQAIRIYVNDEINELRRGLVAAEKVLAPKGRLIVVSFHSLEDREVKQFFSQRSGKDSRVSRHIPINAQKERLPSFLLPKRKLTEPSDSEVTRNPRARSAKLRYAIRTEASPWGMGVIA